MSRLEQIILILISAVTVSCANNMSGNPEPIAYVQRMISDTTSSGYSLVSSYNPDDQSGPIAIIGQPEDVISLTEIMLNMDLYNNVTGKPKSDGLSDFSGETIAMMLDMANSPYSIDGSTQSIDRLREITVRNFMASIDTIYYSSPFNTVHPLKKKGAKFIILASSLPDSYGFYDIDTLCHFAGSDIPVLSISKAILEEIRYTKDPENILIWTDNDSPIAKYNNMAGEFFGKNNIKCEAFTPIKYGSTYKRLTDLLEKYVANGNRSFLTTIIVDDISVDIDSVKIAAEAIIASDDDNLINYKKLLSGNVAYISPKLSLAEQCYHKLRQNNGFTHRISYPSIKPFISTVDEDNISYLYVELKDKYMTESLMDFMSNNAPKTFSLYVR